MVLPLRFGALGGWTGAAASGIRSVVEEHGERCQRAGGIRMEPISGWTVREGATGKDLEAHTTAMLAGIGMC